MADSKMCTQRDRFGNDIYLTHERWQYIIDPQSSRAESIWRSSPPLPSTRVWSTIPVARMDGLFLLDPAVPYSVTRLWNQCESPV
jgi:hypothetical protein